MGSLITWAKNRFTMTYSQNDGMLEGSGNEAVTLGWFGSHCLHALAIEPDGLHLLRGQTCYSKLLYMIVCF
jgi:hypothetical protein